MSYSHISLCMAVYVGLSVFVLVFFFSFFGSFIDNFE